MEPTKTVATRLPRFSVFAPIAAEAQRRRQSVYAFVTAELTKLAKRLPPVIDERVGEDDDYYRPMPPSP